LFFLWQVIRLLRIGLFGFPLGDLIENCVSIFKDGQDEGLTILTPIYLLTGISLPLWLNVVGSSSSSSLFDSSQNIAAALAGVLSIGIGDTFASVGGSKFGSHKWKGQGST